MAYKEKEKYWSRFSKDFEERNKFVVGRKNLEAVFKLLAKQKDLKNCLELGCGNGTYSRVIAPNCTHLKATDHSDEMVLEATQRMIEIPNISVEKANCFNTGYNDKSFDTVFMANLFHIIPHQEEMLTEVKRVLKPGGMLLIVSYTTFGMTFFQKIAMLYRYIVSYGKPSPYAQTIAPEHALESLQKTGFNHNETQLTGKTTKALFVKAYKPS